MLFKTVRSSTLDLLVVLSALVRQPFELMEKIPCKIPILKIIFLVAITSARGVEGNIQILENRIIRRPDSAFLLKAVSKLNCS